MTGKIEVAIIRSNPGSTDPRVLKLYQSLSKKYNVLVLGWDRLGHQYSDENTTKNVAIRRFKLRTPYGNVYARSVLTPLFSLWILINLFRYRPKIVHACDVDTVVACYLYKRLGRNTLVFDLFDRFSLSITKPKIAILVLRSLEEFFSYRADTFVTNSIKLYNTFNRKPKNYAIIMNCPNDEPKTQNCDMPRSQFFKLVFAGYISPERGLEQVAKAILGQEKIKLVVAGQATDNEYIARLKNYSNIEYLGCLQYDEAMCLQSGADAIIIPYDPQLPMNRIGTPNKLFDAMMLGIPVITTVCREIVEETMCGIFVAFEPGSIRDAISRLSNYPFLREEMGINGRKAFENKYNWSLMEKRLLGLYDDLSARRKTKKPTRQKHALTSMRARWPKLWLTKFAEKRQLLLCLSKRP